MKLFKRTPPTQQRWLEDLYRRLVWYFPAAQVKDILSDYQEQFDAGRDHCKMEAEIIQRLGPPDEAAALLLEEEPSVRRNSFLQTGLWTGLLALCSAFPWTCLMNPTSLRMLWTGVFLGLPLTASVLFLLIRGPARVALENSPQKIVSPAAVYVVPALLTLAGTVERAILHIVSTHLSSHLPEKTLERISHSMRFGNGLFWMILLLILTLLALWLLHRSTTVSIRYFPGVVHSIGALETALFQLTYFTSIYIERDIPPSADLFLRLFPYCVGLVTALVFQRWVSRQSPLPRVFPGGSADWQAWRHRLGVRLLDWYDAPQVIEVLEDYQEQYDLGREQGKSEEVLLSGMGRPEAVVRDLLKEDRKARLRHRRTWIWAMLAGISGWLLLSLLETFKSGGMILGQWFRTSAVQISVAAVILGTVSLFVLLHAPGRAEVEKYFPAPRTTTVWPYLLPWITTALTTCFPIYLIVAADTSPEAVLLDWPLPLYVIYVIEFSVLLLLSMLLWTLARCFSGSIQYFPAVPHITGSLTQTLCAGLYITAVDIDITDLTVSILRFLTSLLPCLTGLALLLASRLLLRSAGKPRKEG